MRFIYYGSFQIPINQPIIFYVWCDNTVYIKTEVDKLGAKGPFTDLFIDYKAIKIRLLAGHAEKAATDIASNITGYGIEPKSASLSWLMKQPASLLAYASSFVGQFFSTTLSEFMIKALPYLQGYAVMIISCFIPFYKFFWCFYKISCIY